MLLEEIKQLCGEIKRLSGEVFNRAVENRRHLHSNPELSFGEHETSAFVKSKLDEMGIGWEQMADTGVVAIIKGVKPSDQVVALRADMDALPIAEANDVSYASRRKGVMHACGHDAHTASLLGTAQILQRVRHRFGGTVKLIFQPAEEKLPGGAHVMIREGVLESPRPGAVIGQHVMPSLPVGKIALRKGVHMASVDNIYLTVQGRGGHGAMPHLTVDPLLISAHIIVALQQVISRMNNPTLPGVLSFGRMIADGATNVIPDEVRLEGTFRTMDESWRTEAHRRIGEVARSIAGGMGGSVECRIDRGYPVLVNETSLTGLVEEYAVEYMGRDNVVMADMWMAGEDFAYYSHVAASCFYLLGVGNKEKGIVSALHTSTFDIDEDALGHSTGLMAYVALRRLGN